MGEEFEALDTLDQEMLMNRLANELPQIRKELKLEAEEFAGRIGRTLLETKGLFPKELKKAMSINRNAHPPVTG